MTKDPKQKRPLTENRNIGRKATKPNCIGGGCALELEETFR
jgi:hypothetical protein